MTIISVLRKILSKNFILKYTCNIFRHEFKKFSPYGRHLAPVVAHTIRMITIRNISILALLNN